MANDKFSLQHLLGYGLSSEDDEKVIINSNLHSSRFRRKQPTNKLETLPRNCKSSCPPRNR